MSISRRDLLDAGYSSDEVDMMLPPASVPETPPRRARDNEAEEGRCEQSRNEFTPEECALLFAPAAQPEREAATMEAGVSDEMRRCLTRVSLNKGDARSVAILEAKIASLESRLQQAESREKEMRDALRLVGIFNSDEAGDDGSEWCVTLEPLGEEPAGTLSDALDRLIMADSPELASLRARLSELAAAPYSEQWAAIAKSLNDGWTIRAECYDPSGEWRSTTMFHPVEVAAALHNRESET